MGGRNEAILAEGLGARRKQVVVATKCNRYGNRCVIANDPYDHASIRPANHGIHRDLQHGF